MLKVSRLTKKSLEKHYHKEKNEEQVFINSYLRIGRPDVFRDAVRLRKNVLRRATNRRNSTKIYPLAKNTTFYKTTVATKISITFLTKTALQRAILR